jgi:hypothetical protein
MNQQVKNSLNNIKYDSEIKEICLETRETLKEMKIILPETAVKFNRLINEVNNRQNQRRK